jgi:cytochrome c-type biogenesis protein CcmE
MNRIHQQRLIYICLLIVSLSLATSLILYALKQNINAFVTPNELLSSSQSVYPVNQSVRLGGMVKPGSIIRDKTGLGVQFIVTDFKREVTVQYNGVLPDLFREGKGMIAEGKLTSPTIFTAIFILAKHDENYMPPNQAALVAHPRSSIQTKQGHTA